MIRRLVRIFGLVALLAASLPVQAVPILDLENFENRAPEGTRYGRGMSGNITVVAIGSDSVFTPAEGSIIGTTGSGEFIDSPNATPESFLESASFSDASSGAGSAFSDTSTLSGNTWACGQPGWWFSCIERVLLAPTATVVPLDSKLGDASDQTLAEDGRTSAGTGRRRYLPAVAPMAVVLLTSGVAAAGFAGWRTVKKGRRRWRRSRRRRLGLSR